MNIRAIFEITLTAQEQGLAKMQQGVDVALPCQSDRIILRLENGKSEPPEDAEGGR